MLKSRIPQIIVELEIVAREAENDGAGRVEQAAKNRAPRQSGALHDAIHKQPEQEGTYVVAGDDEVFYGHMVEHGTSHAAPRPFLVPALEENREPIIRDTRARLGRL